MGLNNIDSNIDSVCQDCLQEDDEYHCLPALPGSVCTKCTDKECWWVKMGDP